MLSRFTLNVTTMYGLFKEKYPIIKGGETKFLTTLKKAIIFPLEGRKLTNAALAKNSI